ncbi:MAG: hypothetical protein IH899_07490 [Planctomycetes bacterium]|nr:hypothetical protein [Planctomycetota bacterium]
MKFVGADLHKKSITFCVVEVVGRQTHVVRRQRILCKQVTKIENFLKALGAYQVTVEATIGYDWFAALAEKSARRVVIAHAAGWHPASIEYVIMGHSPCRRRLDPSVCHE